MIHLFESSQSKKIIIKWKLDKYVGGYTILQSTKKRHWVLTNTLCLNNVIHVSSKFTLIACLSHMHYKSHMHY